MKRNAIFMWAYITFMGLSIILRLFLEYEFWNPIVLSVTLSSIFFAFEDLFSLLYQTQKNSCDMIENFVKNARHKKQEDLSFFNKYNELIEQFIDKKPTLVAAQKISHKQIKRLEEVLEVIAELEEINLKERKKEKTFNLFSCIFAYIGFLLLFISLIGSTLISIPSLIQEIISVVSFTIILITQQINNMLIEKIERDNKQTKEVWKKIVDDSDQWYEVKENFKETMIRLDNNCVKTEESNNAD